jgi:hypothetical protein
MVYSVRLYPKLSFQIFVFFSFTDYHNTADHIVSTLVTCALCYAKTNDHVHAIQYATEALQYNKMDSNALLCRAKAFENEKL